MLKILTVEASDCFEDDNNGYIYGIEYYDEEDIFPIDVEWFKTSEEREEAIKQAQNDIFEITDYQ